MSATAIGVGAIRGAPNANGTARCQSPLWRLGVIRAHAALLLFLEALVPPGAPPLSAEDEADWPRYPPF